MAVQMTRGAKVSIIQMATNLGIHATKLSLWLGEKTAGEEKTFRGQGVPLDEKLVNLKQDLAHLKRERDFSNNAGPCLPRTR